MTSTSRFFQSLIISVVLVASTACLSHPVRHYYQISVDDRVTTPSEKGLAVAAVEMDDFYDSYRIVYRNSQYEVNRYLYHLWYKKPSQMIRENIAAFFKTGDQSQPISEQSGGSQAGYILFCRVLCIEEQIENRQTWARLSMELQLRDVGGEKGVLMHRFDRREVVTGRRVRDLVKTFSIILNQELMNFNGLIGKALSQAER